MNIEWLVRIAGVLQLGLLTASALVPKVLDWRRQLRPLDRLVRQLVWTYGGYVVLMIIGLGLVSLTQAAALTDGTTLARSITGFITLFWLIRLVLQLAVFDSRRHLTTRFLRFGHHGLTATFTYLVIVFTWATIR
jgi:hypothetical protein